MSNEEGNVWCFPGGGELVDRPPFHRTGVGKFSSGRDWISDMSGHADSERELATTPSRLAVDARCIHQIVEQHAFAILLIAACI